MKITLTKACGFFLFLISVFFFGSISNVSAQHANSSWPMFGHDQEHTGQSAYLGPIIGQKKWSLLTDRGPRTSTASQSTPITGPDGIIYIGTDDAGYGFRLYAVKPDGNVQWYYETNDCYYDCRYSTPAIGSDGTVYIMKPGGLYAINPNGTLKWIATIPIYNWVYKVSSPAIAPDGTLYVGGSGGLYAVNPNGGIKWIYKTGGVASSPAIDASSGVIYFASHHFNSYVYAVNSDGTLKWKYQPDQFPWFVSSPAIGPDGTVYIGVQYAQNKAFQGLLAINPNGTLEWTYPIDGGVESTPAIAADGTVYVASNDSDQALHALMPNGSLKWIFLRGGLLSFSSPAIGGDGTVYLGSTVGKLYAITPDGGAKWIVNFSAPFVLPSVSSPAIGSNGEIFVFVSELTFQSSGDDVFVTKLHAIGQPDIVVSPTDCLFNWAEKNYPTLFAPSGAPTQVWPPYNYRYYSATNAYLGISSVDNHVYYMGPDGKLQNEGSQSYWLPLAGCQ
ncbi:MAG: PQQ-binding-like beta-propeller repeat protein [Methylococcales bacterium]|nr:PQQ-binding-like beta-propeller repeat protein [Methylococcales bacterium]